MNTCFNENDKFAIARKRMMNDQIITRGITDAKVLEVMNLIPRHDFVDEALSHQAYSDGPLSIGDGQTISQPYIVALMTQALNLNGRQKILEIGTGCGYQTVILSMMAERVHTIERVKTLGMKARNRFKQYGLKNIIMRIGDGSAGWPEAEPFDRILVTCAAPVVPDLLVKQLAVGGILVVPVSNAAGYQELLRMIRTEEGIKTQNLGACHFVRLIGKHGYHFEEA